MSSKQKPALLSQNQEYTLVVHRIQSLADRIETLQHHSGSAAHMYAERLRLCAYTLPHPTALPGGTGEYWHDEGDGVLHALHLEELGISARIFCPTQDGHDDYRYTIYVRILGQEHPCGVGHDIDDLDTAKQRVSNEVACCIMHTTKWRSVIGDIISNMETKP